ncbi:MAG: hypothetical protein IPM82_08475 [Saprospiraceae bacterium]|nr:hypothetical protein [Saprospiraceae bacterium]
MAVDSFRLFFLQRLFFSITKMLFLGMTDERGRVITLNFVKKWWPDLHAELTQNRNIARSDKNGTIIALSKISFSKQTVEVLPTRHQVTAEFPSYLKFKLLDTNKHLVSHLSV